MSLVLNVLAVSFLVYVSGNKKSWTQCMCFFFFFNKLPPHVFALQLYSRPNRLLSGVPLYKGDGQPQDKSAVTSLLDGLNQAFEEVSSQVGWLLVCLGVWECDSIVCMNS